jgi:hypothetical protein
VLVAFDAYVIREGLRPHVDRAWRRLQERSDYDDLLNLIDVFWFVKQTDALVYVGDKIRLLEPEPRSISELQFVMSHNLPPRPAFWVCWITSGTPTKRRRVWLPPCYSTTWKSARRSCRWF